MTDLEIKKKQLLHLIERLTSFSEDELLPFCDISFVEESPVVCEDDGVGGYKFKQSGPHTLSIRISDPTGVGEYVE